MCSDIVGVSPASHQQYHFTYLWRQNVLLSYPDQSKGVGKQGESFARWNEWAVI